MTATPTRAAVFRGKDAGLRIEDVLVPAPGPGEVLLRVAACGACHSDVHKLEGHGTVPVPNVLGHEIAGVVEQVGPGVDAFAPGDRVVCGFLVPCGECTDCARGRDDDCLVFRRRMQTEGVSLRGGPRFLLPDGTQVRGSGVGGLAEHTALPVTALAAAPDRVRLADAAVLGCAGLTAYGAVYRSAQLEPGETAVVIAVGGVGLCVTALAAHRGAGQVITVDLRPEALEVSKRFGATRTAHGTADDVRDAVLAATDGRGADVVFDTIGTAATLRQAVGLAGVGGRVVVSGLAGTDAPGEIDLVPFVRRRLRLVGSYAARTRRDLPALLDVVADGALDPADLISAHYPFDAAADAYAATASGGVLGRALIEIGADRV